MDITAEKTDDQTGFAASVPSRPMSKDGDAAAEKIDYLWGTVLATLDNPSPDMTLKAPGRNDESASWLPLSTQSPRTATPMFFAPSMDATRVGSITIRTSRMSHLPASRYGADIANADGNDFIITEPLGRGGMGVVYSARQSSLNRDVAVKMISPEVSGKEDYRRKMVSEALVTGELEHPNIIPIYELGRTESDDLFYAMKIVKGDPWSQSLAGKSLRENIEVLLRVCDAVAFAHDKGIIHRDLKPANVMLGNYGEVLLMDWGLAVSLRESANVEQLSPGNSVAGTPSYMAPEMALGDFMRIGTASDIYLLGAILYEIVTGQRPHSGSTASESILAAADNAITPPLHMDELTRVAMRAMETEPEDRYATVKDFQKAVVTVQIHSESLALTVNADNSLRGAIETRDYDEFAQALFAYTEAVKLWDGNDEAVKGRMRAKREYALCAYEKGDYDLALSAIGDADDDEARELKARIQSARDDVEARKRRIRVLTRAAIGLTVAVVVILGLSTLIISDRMARERQARRVASMALEETQEARRNEQIAAAERETALLHQREAQADALRAASERERALRSEMEALAQAEEERRRKEEAEKARLAIEQELTRKGHLEDDSWWGFNAATAREKTEAASRQNAIPATLETRFGDAAAPTGFALIPPGVYVMGSSPSGRYHAPDEFLHRVELHSPFYMGVAEVTRSEWRALVGLEEEAVLMPKFNPELSDETEEAFRERELRVWGWRTRPLSDNEGNLPATGVSPDEIIRLFLPRAMAHGPNGWLPDLPTEAEWEYACRAGTSTELFTGDIGRDTPLPGWTKANSGLRPHRVKGLEANPWGLYDTHGNAGEIVKDYYAADYYRASPPDDPVNTSPSGFRVFRGGTFIHENRKCRSAARFTIHNENRYGQVGFRLVLRSEQ